MGPRIEVMKEVGRTGRATRSPKHPFQIRHGAFILQPFAILPVLPGETLKSLHMQDRAVGDPVKNRLLGARLEHYFYYVKHRDLVNNSQMLQDMMLQYGLDVSSMNSAANVYNYHYAASIDWVQLCMDRIVATHFRDEPDVSRTIKINNMHQVMIEQSSYLDSFMADEVYEPIVDVVVDADANSIVTASEVQRALQQYEFLKDNGVIDMDYEDWLATFGIRKPKVEEHYPELLRYFRNWTYPTNTVEPTTGVPSSAWNWSVQDSAQKQRFFKEPGFIIGLTCVRPKVYLGGSKGAAVGMLNNAMAWLPALMRGDPSISYQKFAAGTGPLNQFIGNDAGAEAYWLDVRDLFMYGDQFLNFDLAATDAGIVALPTTAGERKFVSAADILALWSDGTGVKSLIHHDGIVQAHIASAEAFDVTPTY